MSVTLVPSAAPVPHPALERARLHRRLGDLVERLIAVMDDLSADPDLEDGADDEPSLGAPEGPASQIVWLRGGDRDLETISPEHCR